MSTGGASKLPSLRLLITLIVVTPIAVVSAVLVVISTSTSRAVAEQLGREIVAGATRDVAGEVREFLSDAVRVSDLYERRLRTGALPASGLRAWEPMLIDDILTNPRVASVCFGNTGGDATWLLRAHGRLELGRVDGARPDGAIELEVDSRGGILPRVLREYRYDPRERPWYRIAAGADRPVWTPIYFWFGEQGAASETGTGYTRAIRGAGGELLGVLVVDVTLSSLSDFLRRLPIAESGHVFIIDDRNELVAASSGSVNSGDGRRMTLSDSESPAARAVAPVVASSGAPSDDAPVLGRVLIDGAAARAKVTRLRPYPGIDWRVVTVLPEASFLTQVQAMQRRAVVLAVLAVVAALGLGLLLARRLSGPLLRLIAHVGRVGSGDLDARLDLRTARELHALSDEINAMTAGLQHRMELEHSLALATHVQRSLLPASAPALASLDIAGRTRYCDSTGGDYYDFIELAPPATGADGDRPVLIAVGDVSGHGIAAALLMASARAAVRAGATCDVPLGQLMSGVNRVLSKDARHGLFMTLLLAVVDAGAGAVRWSSAGHDPLIVYHPATDAFQELTGGDIPLGVELEVPYQEFARNSLAPGTVLVGGTDGIWEARDAAGEMYGKPRLRELIRRCAASDARSIAAALEADLAAFTCHAPLSDDVTFVIVKFRDARPASRERS